ncbi:MAG TPA: (deoxy)nucleoside triphosphate pyrophosphohydrolase [Pirellulales bacterium]|nr:(deoxy)nucleoside triphosphate pyrophosphohydrolase [Pirellulales bacterium]
MSTPIAVAVVEREGCYLVGRRPDGVPLAGLWEFPGGKVEPGETPEDAAARECREEAGLEVEVGAPYATVDHQYNHGRLLLHFFACRPLDPAAAPKPRFCWIPAARLAELPFPEANASLIKELVAKEFRRSSSAH